MQKVFQEVPEACGSGVPGILTPQGLDGERKPCRIVVKREDSPLIAKLVIRSEWA